MDKKQIPYELLAKYLSWQCTTEEQEQVIRWLDEEPGHHLLLDKLRKQWEAVRLDTSAYVIPDKKMVWGFCPCPCVY